MPFRIPDPLWAVVEALTDRVADLEAKPSTATQPAESHAAATKDAEPVRIPDAVAEAVLRELIRPGEVITAAMVTHADRIAPARSPPTLRSPRTSRPTLSPSTSGARIGGWRPNGAPCH